MSDWLPVTLCDYGVTGQYSEPRLNMDLIPIRILYSLCHGERRHRDAPYRLQFTLAQSRQQLCL